MRQSWALACALLGACFSPNPPAGAPCSEDGSCPRGLVCGPDTTCVRPAGPPFDAGPDAPMSMVDAAPAACAAAWADGAPSFTPPVAMDALDTVGNELDPWVTPDELTIYFARGRAFDIYTATRATVAGDFGQATRVAALDSTATDTRVSLTGDGRRAILSSDRASPGDPDLFEATRASATGTFSTPDATALAKVNSTRQELDPELSADGLRLYFSVLGSGSPHHLELATRTSTLAAFDEPVPVMIFGESSAVADPSVSPDGKLLLYSAVDPSTGTTDLHVALPISASGLVFQARGALPFNSAQSDGDAALSADECRVYFSSNRPGGTGGRDLYVTSVVMP